MKLTAQWSVYILNGPQLAILWNGENFLQQKSFLLSNSQIFFSNIWEYMCGVIKKREMFCGIAVEFLKDTNSDSGKHNGMSLFSFIFLYGVIFFYRCKSLPVCFPLFSFFVSATLFASFFNYNERRISFLPVISFCCIYCAFYYNFLIFLLRLKKCWGFLSLNYNCRELINFIFKWRNLQIKDESIQPNALTSP